MSGAKLFLFCNVSRFPNKHYHGSRFSTIFDSKDWVKSQIPNRSNREVVSSTGYMVIYYVMYYFWSTKRFTSTVKPLALQKKRAIPPFFTMLSTKKNAGVFGFRRLGLSPTTVWAPHVSWIWYGLPKQTRGIFSYVTLTTWHTEIWWCFQLPNKSISTLPKMTHQFSRIPLTGSFVGGHVPRFQLQRELHQRLVKPCTQSQLLRFHPQGDLILHVPARQEAPPPDPTKHKVIEKKHFKCRIWSSLHRKWDKSTSTGCWFDHRLVRDTPSKLI